MRLMNTMPASSSLMNRSRSPLSLVQALGPSWTFWLYGLLAIASFVFAYALVPETKGRTLEEIEKSWRFA